MVYKQIVLPTGKAYVFTWANGTPGDLQSMTLPTGATISYTYGDFYQTQFGPAGTEPSYSGGRSIASRTVTTGGVSNEWTYDINGAASTVTDPLGNSEVHHFSLVETGTGSSLRESANHYETQVIYLDPSGNTLRTVNTAYAANADNVSNLAINVRPTQKTTILENGQQMQTQTDYETFTYTCTTCNTDAGGVGVATRMNPTETRVYDYGAGAPGALLKRTDYTYLHNTNSAYVPLNIVDRATSVTVYDGSGNKVSQSTNEYDNYSHTGQPMQASNAMQHGSSYGTGYTTRGNLTGVSVWRNTDGALLTTTSQYDDAGNVLSTIDPLGHETSYSYADSWANSACVPSGTAAAFPTKVTNAKGQATSTKYNACTGTVGSTTDLNGQSTGYTYDAFDRPKQVTPPTGGGQKTFCYSDDATGTCYSTTSLFSTETDAIGGSTNQVATTVYDGLGRVQETQLNSDPNGTDYVDTTYDSDERPSATSNPYRTGDTKYWTTTGYDGLGRVLAVTKADGSASSTAYAGNTTTITDEAGNKRKSQTDALGRLNTVWEDPAGLNYETDYTYYTLGPLQKVTQKGGDANAADWRIRSFTYDSLGELLCSANPEIGSPLAAVASCPATDTGSYIAGTVRYSYNNDGELTSKTAPLPNQTGTSTVTTSYAYDALHRATGITYADTTASVAYTYDADAVTGCTAPSLTGTNLVGHMKAMCDGSGSTAWSYDAMGRTLTEARRIGTVTDQIGYTYYLNGAVNTVTYPLGGGSAPFVMTYNENAAGRTDTATGSDGVVYGHVASTYARGASHVWSLGTNVQVTDTYNARLQPLATTAEQVSTTNTLFSRSYNFHAGAGDNGNLYGVQDGLDGLGLNRPNGSVNYGYDALNRINSAATTGTACTAMAGGTLNWASTYAVDAWGNLTAKTPTGCVGESMAAVSTNSRNQLSGATYDSAGDVTQKGGLGFTYDAEGRVINGSGTGYTYDGMGERVEKTGKLYWKGVGSTALMETNASDTSPTKYIFFNGERIARVDAGTTAAKYYVTDNVGSTALVTDSVGNMLNESLFFPYGVERMVMQNDTGNNYKFSGKERDAETGLDDFGARYYDSSLGRFMTPDWAAKPASVPYASFGDPQTLNLYSYVENGPLNRVDADGHSSSPVVDGGGAAFEPQAYWQEACVGRFCDMDDLAKAADPEYQDKADEEAYDATVAEGQQQVQQQKGQQQGADQQTQSQGSGSTTLNFSGANTKITYDYGAIFSNEQGGVKITATAQNCDSCYWAQVVSRTGNGAESPKKDGGGIGPLYGLESPASNYFLDTPATPKGGHGTFSAVAILGTTNIAAKFFKVRGGMSYGYQISAGGNFSFSAPRKSTATELNGAVKVLQSHSPDWQIQ